ncbi:MAG: hypothetical protein FD144_2683 [Rhodospirillaceae bacterium]|nr:MAG: hypothetical protein FD144_2683 [Rhodospirillaceae bacterium]
MQLDPETLLGIKSEVLKAAVSASLLGVLWRRQFKFAEAVSALAAGLGSAVYVAPLVLAHTGITHPDIRGGVIFIIGLLGTHVFAALTTAAPDVLRRIIYKWTGVAADPPPPPPPPGPTGGGAT